MRDDKIRHTLSERFADYGSKPSEGVWDAIDTRLDNEGRTFKFIWWAFTFLALTIVSLSLLNNSTGNASAPLVAKTSEKVDQHSSGEKEHVQTSESVSKEASTEEATVQSTNSKEPVSERTTQNGKNKIASTGAATEKKNNPSLANAVTTSTLNTNKSQMEMGLAGDAKDKPVSSEGVPTLPADRDLLAGTSAKQVAPEEVTDPSSRAEAENAGSDEKAIEDKSLFQLTTAEVKKLEQDENTLGELGMPPHKYKFGSPNWEFQMRLGTFNNLGHSSKANSYLNESTWQLVNTSPPDDLTQNYKRFAELQVSIKRRIAQRFQVSLGMATSFSQNKGKSLNGDIEFVTNQVSFGIPVEISYTLLQYKRFAFKPYLGVLNDFNIYLQKSSIQSGNAADQSLTAPTVETNYMSENGYSFGIQPSVEFYYYMNENTSVSLSCGYRKYLLGRTNGQSPGIMQPNYLHGAVSLAWILR